MKEALAKDKLVSDLELKQAKVDAEQLGVRSQIAKEQLESKNDSMRAQMAVQQSAVDQARALLALTRQQKDELKVRAGLDGMRRGLAVIAARSDSLSRFTTAYARLAKLPAPRLDSVKVLALVSRIVSVETRLGVKVESSPDLTVRADRDQLEQLLINLVHNAVDAAIETRGGVSVGWRAAGRQLELWIDDEGAGLPNASNLFVPFFTTKPGGSGIGLVFSPQIAEAHGGSLTLQNRTPAPGCRAELTLPLG